MKDKQRELLNKNIDKMEDDKKKILVSIGESLLNIQYMVNTEKLKTLTKKHKRK